MYRARDPITDPRELEQGDIIANFWRPRPPEAKSILGFNSSGQCADFKDKAPLGKLTARVVSHLEKVPFALVVSNSCDNTQGAGTVVLVPIRDFSPPLDPTADVMLQWKRINEAATGAATPKMFYLPAEPHFGLVRSQAVLSDFISVRPNYLTRCFEESDARRIGGLTLEAQRHLQWALALVFGRNAREDYDWPSVADIELRIASLEALIAKGSKGQEDLKADLVRARAAHKARSEALAASLHEDEPLPFNEQPKQSAGPPEQEIELVPIDPPPIEVRDDPTE